VEIQKENMKKLILAIAAAPIFLVGCASHTGIIPMGQGNYMIAKQQATGFPGLGNLKAEIITEGLAQCTSQGRKFELVSSQETQPPYILGNYPRSEIMFRCI
jgi:hypothetical protein